MSEFTVITPSLNAARFIGDCISSVAMQGQEVEHIVVDGGSTDRTKDVIRESGSLARVVDAPPEGIYAAINMGIQNATGEVIGVLHADDFYASPATLEQVASVFLDPSIDTCYGDLCYVHRSDTTRVIRYWRAGEFRPGRFRHGWMPPHPTFFVRREVYDRLGIYRTDLGTAADYEFMLRLLVKNGIDAAYIPQVLVHMRAGGSSNASWAARFAANRMDRKAWKVNGLHPYPWTTLVKPLRKIRQWWSRP